MTSLIASSEAARQYAAAYAAHYSQRNLLLASQLYQDILFLYPNALEADYARMQLHSMFTLTVPQQIRVDAEILLLEMQLKEGSAPYTGLSLGKCAASA